MFFLGTGILACTVSKPGTVLGCCVSGFNMTAKQDRLFNIEGLLNKFPETILRGR